LEAEGIPIPPSSRRGPWWSARDGALEIVGASNPIVARFGSYDDWQAFWYSEFEREGIPEAEWGTELSSVNRNAGLDKEIEGLRQMIVQRDPGIVDALME